MKIINMLMFKLTGRKVPVFRVAEINWVGRIGTLQKMKPCKDLPNSILNLYDEKAWEKDPETSPVTVLDEWGNPSQAWIVSADGSTVNLYTKPVDFPKREQVQGRLLMMDIIGEAMDLGKSLRNMLIGIVIGIPIGWWVIGPIFGGLMG